MDKIIIRSIDEVPPLSISLQPTLWNRTGSWRYLRPVYSDEKISPCTGECPIHQKIPSWLGLVAEGKFQEALSVLMEDNPFPGICGRVCHHPCEPVCNRKDYDEAVSIHIVERFLGDYGKANSVPGVQRVSRKKQRVAVIGSGPAGLSCAYHLARKGYQVKVFEALPEPGGMLRVIPPYRLPSKVLDREISRIQSLGVEFVKNTKVDNELFRKDLSEFEAIFVATGATVEERLGIPGEDLKGVFLGVEFLRSANTNEKVKIAEKVVVIGGGNTAIDCARTLWRMGRRPTVLYRRTREQMPAIGDEVEEALKEGLQIEYLISPIRMSGRNGKVAKIECVRNRLTATGKDGRPKPVPIQGSNFFIEADAVILALGAHPDIRFVKGQLKGKDHHISTDRWGRTNRGGVFAGGDVATGLGTVSDAIGSGKKAAIAIDSILQNRSLPSAPRAEQTVGFKDLNVDYFTHSKKAKVPRLPVRQRARGFREVNKRIATATAVRESNRCFSCGFCNDCNICLMVCPDVAISRTDTNLAIDYEYCKGCGICAVECPRSVINLEREELWRR